MPIRRVASRTRSSRRRGHRATRACVRPTPISVRKSIAGSSPSPDPMAPDRFASSARTTGSRTRRPPSSPSQFGATARSRSARVLVIVTVDTRSSTRRSVVPTTACGRSMTSSVTVGTATRSIATASSPRGSSRTACTAAWPAGRSRPNCMVSTASCGRQAGSPSTRQRSSTRASSARRVDPVLSRCCRTLSRR